MTLSDLELLGMSADCSKPRQITLRYDATPTSLCSSKAVYFAPLTSLARTSTMWCWYLWIRLILCSNCILLLARLKSQICVGCRRWSVRPLSVSWPYLDHPTRSYAVNKVQRSVLSTYNDRTDLTTPEVTQKSPLLGKTRLRASFFLSQWRYSF